MYTAIFNAGQCVEFCLTEAQTSENLPVNKQ